MIFCIFYVTKNFLCKATEEMYSKPDTLCDKKHYQLLYHFFLHKIRSKKEVVWMPFECWSEFGKTKHFEPFKLNKTLSNTIDIDGNEEEYGNEDEAIIKRASYKAGEVGDADIIVVGIDEETKTLAEKAKGYPINIKTVIESIKKIKQFYDNK